MLTTFPQCNSSQEFPDMPSKNLICYHWLSVYGNSKIMHCGILFNMPYWKCFRCGSVGKLDYWSASESMSSKEDDATFSLDQWVVRIDLIQMHKHKMSSLGIWMMNDTNLRLIIHKKRLYAYSPYPELHPILTLEYPRNWILNRQAHPRPLSHPDLVSQPHLVQLPLLREQQSLHLSLQSWNRSTRKPTQL